VLLIVLTGILAAGFIYAAVVFHAVNERSQSHHVTTHSAR
jgi:hypothetical protein